MHVSIIIPTYNRAAYLNDLLKSLIDQEKRAFFDYEALIVDNGSTDSTPSVCEKLIAQYGEQNVRYINEPVPGLLAARHRGVIESEGDILIFIDDDIIPGQNWLISIADTFLEQNVHLVGGKSLPVYEESPPSWHQALWTQVSEIKSSCGYLSLLDYGETYCEIDHSFIWGLNYAVRKNSLKLAGGFHPDGLPWHLRKLRGDGESGLSHSLKSHGLKAIYHPAATVYHRISKDRLSLDYISKRSYLQGISDSYTQIRSQNGCHAPEESMKLRISKRINKLTSLLSLLKDSKKRNFFNVFSTISQAYQEGFSYHQQEAMKSSRLMDWILKENYWDYRLPE
ncbi:MAG: Chondroitin synthase [Syntrophus sp. PtaU1.Bin005]|jgi:glycosyltransferase involved in cell wall biosynthesis|nr:MAG: Chondroitin synthase [Syntrophus sp. PtaU1.Bin005]